MTGSETAVVITCFELGATLPAAVESVLAQTAPAQEVVVVDDGSTGVLTRQTLDWLEAHEPRVRLIRAEHGGAAHARNAGIAATTAPFVVLLDGDDLFEPAYLEQATALLREREDLSFVCCALQAFGRASYRWKPPPYTIAEALGRGACGHISTVFRREVWADGPGFDPSLPAYEDVDFWLGALRRGLRGAILDEALVRYRVRQGSRYHSAVVRGGYLRAKELLLDKHLAPSAVRGEDVLVTLLDFERELAGHAAFLRAERERLEDALVDAEGEIAEARDALAAQDIPALAWSAPQERDPGAVERHLMERMLRELCPDADPQRTLRIEPGDPWPAPAKPAYDLVAIAGALERERDPRAALERCRAALRPGGRLAVAAATTALAPGVRRGFTEASLRALLCASFPPAEVRVASDGNLMTCLCAVAGAPLSALSPAELEAVDPAHATVVAGTARVPARGGRRRAARGDGGVRPPLGTPAEPPRRAAILAYHRVAALRPDVHRLCTPPELFAAHMELLAERCHPVSLAELAAQAAAGELRPGTVAVTFDDGYLDNFEIASPIAADLGIPLTCFVSGTPARQPRESWWDTVERILLGEEPIPPRLSLEAGGAMLSRPTRSDAERRAALHALHGRLLGAGAEDIEAIVAALVEWSGLDLPPRRSHRLMTADELAELAARPGHAIGAHGLHHLLLPAQEPAAQARELGGSKAALERVLGAPVELLAYPYGACDVAVAQLAGELGFAVACTVEPDGVGADSDPLRLPRLEVAGDDDVDRLRLRLGRALAAAP
jgi:peptidoglycan/xylan/chitin deacetylase (PgdA/CDA1 family)/glycosyltransferase involved in cell wall biosynthesis